MTTAYRAASRYPISAPVKSMSVCSAYTDVVPVRLSVAVRGELTASLAALRDSLEVPHDFPSEVLAEAAAARPSEAALDLRDVPFITIDPPGSRDLDQALHLERHAAGYRVRYAIADVPAFVEPGGAVDAEARRRGQTLYAADGTVPLHPPVLSEDRTSLLADADRTAYVWTIDLDDTGARTGTRVERAMVRSRAQWDYATAQRAVDAADDDSPVALLPVIGALRIERERLRGGASLDLPDEVVVADADRGYRIERRLPLPVEEWNAQLSLLTGMAAASLMLDAGVGILRTMPAPDTESIAAFRAKTRALGREWSAEQPYGEYLRGLDVAAPAATAVLRAAASLFRGAGYTPFDGAPPADTVQAAVAAPYAHVTAPLRRLVDRWGLVICAAASAGREVPSWARASLGELPELMDASSQRASRLSTGTLDRVEAAVLSGRVGETFDAVVAEVRQGRARIQLDEPVVAASCPVGDGVRAGQRLAIRLVAADIAGGVVQFEAAE